MFSLNNYINLQKIIHCTGEIVQQLRAGIALTEHLSLIPNSQLSITSTLGDLISLVSLGALTHGINIHTYTYLSINKEI